MPRPQRTVRPARIIHSVDELPAICDCVDAGLLLRLYPEKVAAMAAAGVLRGAKQGQKWYFRRSDLENYLNRLFGEEAQDP